MSIRITNALRCDDLSYLGWRSHDVFCTVQHNGDERVELVCLAADFDVADDYVPTVQVLTEGEDYCAELGVSYRYIPLAFGPVREMEGV